MQPGTGAAEWSPPDLQRLFTTGSTGLQMQYTVSGQGNAVLLLHGLGSGAGSWHPLFPTLGRSHRLICPDHRGSGGSELGAEGFSIAELADDAVAVLDAAGIQSAHVVGNSFGGMVAQELVLRHPERVRSLVLVATSPGLGGVPSHPALAWHLLRATRSRGAGRRHHLDRAFHGPASVVDAPERLVRDPGDDPLPRGRGPLRQLAAALRWSALSRLRRVAVPTLVVHGTHDRLIPAANARMLAQLIPHARLRLLPRAGHFVITDAGDIAGSLIARFLGEVDSLRTAAQPVAVAGSQRRLPAPAAA